MATAELVQELINHEIDVERELLTINARLGNLKAGGRRGEGDHDLKNLIMLKDSGSTPNFGGRWEDFDGWSFKIKALLESKDLEFSAFFNMLEECLSEVDEDDLRLHGEARNMSERKVGWMNNQLYKIPARKTSWNPLQMMKNIADKVDTEAWARIMETSKKINENRAMILRQKVHNPNRVNKFVDVTPMFEIWKGYVKEWARTSGSNAADCVKRNSRRQPAPAELDQNMSRLSCLDIFEDIWKCVCV